MNLRLLHRVIYEGKTHRFTVMVECPFQPKEGFMLVFRNEKDGDDCALLVSEIYGWDVSSQALLVRTTEWNIDDWHPSDATAAQASFEDSKQQLVEVVQCEYIGVK